MTNINRDIIVIGNGSSVLKHNVGDVIDSFTDVVRFNDYQTVGYEKQIGSRTTVWARSNSVRTKERNWSLYTNVIVASPEWNFGTVQKIIKGKSNAIVIPKEQSLALQTELKLPGRKVKKGVKAQRGWPSTGILVIDFLLKTHEVIYIHGFDFFQKENGYPRHYYNKIEKMTVTHVHDSNKEKEWVNQKVRDGRIKFLV
jgi:hypothetical protein